MKKVVLSALVFVSIFACKKEKTPVTPVVTGPTKHCTATVNGSAFTAGYYTLSGGGDHIFYDISADTGVLPGPTQPTIRLEGKIQTGIHALGLPAWPNVYTAIYKKDNVNYYSVSGSINISAFDTSGTTILKHFTATFNFNTDTIAGTSYQITNGDIDYFN
ncbi:MAG: hypothetical protein V4547_02175 [Bacteroidota bacterium]